MSNPCFIRQFTCFLRQFLSLLSSSCGIVCTVRKWEEGVRGSHGWCGDGRGLVCEFMLAHDLMYQPKVQWRVPVWLPVLHDTKDSSSTDHMWVWYHKWDWNSTVYPAPHVQNGFVHFRCHDLTQFHNYHHAFLPYHAININNKQRKMFPLILSVITMIILDK